MTIGLAHYPGMYSITKQYQKNTKEVQNFSKKVVPNLSSLRLLLIDTLIVRPEIHAFIATHLLTPLIKNLAQSPAEIITPIASLPEHAGMMVSFRDYLGPGLLEEYETAEGLKKVFASGRSREVWECTLDAHALRRGKVVVLSTGECEEEGGYRVGSHGFPFPTSSVAIVDPETTLLCPPDRLGEVWIDMPALPDGFWGIPALTEAVYRASPKVVPTETLFPENIKGSFVRTGLLGTLIGGRLVLFGPYEECIRQQQLNEPLGIEEIHFGSDLVSTLSKRCQLDAW